MGHHSFGKIPVCTTDPQSTQCPACFWVSGHFWPCWQPLLFIQWLWVAMLALTFRLNWPSSLKDTEQNKERLCYKYTEIGHASLPGEPFISPVIILPGGSMRLWVLCGACPRHASRSSRMAVQPSCGPQRWSSLGPLEGTGPLYYFFCAEGLSPGLPCLLRNCY